MTTSDLRQRAAAAAGHNNDRTPARAAPDAQLRADIAKMQSQFALAMPRGAEAAQLVRDALTELRRTPKLADCTPASVLGALMTCAQLGLRPGVLGQAWLLPFYDSKTRRHHAQLVIGYQGLAELAYRSDRVAGISARTVFRNDVFDVELGTEDRIVHRPAAAERGDPVGYYCVVHIKGGRPVFYWMSHHDMLEYRDRYAMARNRNGQVVGPWVDQFEAMAHKTCLRQLAKWMPKSTDLAVALEADDGVRVDVSPTVTPEEATHHYDTDTTDEPDPAPDPEPSVPEDSSAAEPPSTRDTAAEPPPEDDVVDAELVGDIEVIDDPADAQPRITRVQERGIKAAFTGFGVAAEDRLRYVQVLVGRDVSSLGDLTRREADQLAKDLGPCESRADLDGLTQTAQQYAFDHPDDQAEDPRDEHVPLDDEPEPEPDDDAQP